MIFEEIKHAWSLQCGAHNQSDRSDDLNHDQSTGKRLKDRQIDGPENVVPRSVRCVDRIFVNVPDKAETSHCDKKAPDANYV